MLPIIEYAVKVRVDLFTCRLLISLLMGEPNTLTFYRAGKKIAIFTVSAGKMDKNSVKIMSLLEVYFHFSSTVEISNYSFPA